MPTSPTISPLGGKKIALLLCSGFEEKAFVLLQRGLVAAGASVSVISRDHGLTNGWAGESWGLSYPVDKSLSETLAVDYDIMVIPDGSRHSDMLINNQHGERIISAFLREDAPSLIIGSAIISLQSKEYLANFDSPDGAIKCDKTLVTAPAGADTDAMIAMLGQATADADADAPAAAA